MDTVNVSRTGRYTPLGQKTQCRSIVSGEAGDSKSLENVILLDRDKNCEDAQTTAPLRNSKSGGDGEESCCYSEWQERVWRGGHEATSDNSGGGVGVVRRMVFDLQPCSCIG